MDRPDVQTCFPRSPNLISPPPPPDPPLAPHTLLCFVGLLICYAVPPFLLFLTPSPPNLATFMEVGGTIFSADCGLGPFVFRLTFVIALPTFRPASMTVNPHPPPDRSPSYLSVQFLLSKLQLRIHRNLVNT